MKEVFAAVKEIVAKYVVVTTENKLTLKNAAGRSVFINLSHDPDVCVQEQVSNQTHHRVAIEVKGGTDVSNAHNRAGEAEKSHQKAKKSGVPGVLDNNLEARPRTLQTTGGVTNDEPLVRYRRSSCPNRS